LGVYSVNYVASPFSIYGLTALLEDYLPVHIQTSELTGRFVSPQLLSLTFLSKGCSSLIIQGEKKRSFHCHADVRV